MPNNHESVVAPMPLPLGSLPLAWCSCWWHLPRVRCCLGRHSRGSVVGCGGGVELGQLLPKWQEAVAIEPKTVFGLPSSGWLADRPHRYGMVCRDGPMLDHWSGPLVGPARLGLLGGLGPCS